MTIRMIQRIDTATPFRRLSPNRLGTFEQRKKPIFGYAVSELTSARRRRSARR